MWPLVCTGAQHAPQVGVRAREVRGTLPGHVVQPRQRPLQLPRVQHAHVRVVQLQRCEHVSQVVGARRRERVRPRSNQHLRKPTSPKPSLQGEPPTCTGSSVERVKANSEGEPSSGGGRTATVGKEAPMTASLVGLKSSLVAIHLPMSHVRDRSCCLPHHPTAQLSAPPACSEPFQQA